MKKLALFVSLFLFLIVYQAEAQTSDNKYCRSLRDVLSDIETQFGVKLRISEKDVEGKVLNYADWRFRPDFDKTISNVLAPFDLVYLPDGAPNKYKIQGYQYHRRSDEDARQTLEALASKYSNTEEWEHRRDEMVPCIKKALRLSPMPAQTTSQPVLTAVRKMDGYTVQNIAIETLPGVYVCGSIYKPSKIKGKIPVVLCPNGHFGNGRYNEQIQTRCAGLARMGAIAVSYDLFAWGESTLQFPSKYHQHSLANTVQALNSIRILDYLLTMKEADSTRVGITGGSGGGNHSILMAAIDSRIKVSVPVVALSSIHYGGCPCESGNPVHFCGHGNNNVELAAMFAPKPQLIVSDGGDWTANVPDREFPYLKRVYNFYGDSAVVENVHLKDEGHDYGVSKRIAMYKFMARYLKLDDSKMFNDKGELDESSITVESQNALKVFGDNGEMLPANAVGFADLEKMFGIEHVADKSKYKIGVCDWMILKRQKLGVFAKTAEIGADGVLLDMGGLGSRPTFDNKLMNPEERRYFKDAQAKYGIEIAGMSMSGFYAQNIAERNMVPLIDECINTMSLMGTNVAFLPLGTEGDLLKYPERRDSIVAKLRIVGRRAEAAGVIVGIETALDAAGEVALLEEIASPAIKIYYNFANALQNGRDLHSELKILGKDRICQILCTDIDDVWLENNSRLDMKKVKTTLDEIGYTGWLVIERSRDKNAPRDVVGNFGANTRYLKSIFQE